ncbi:MAG: hypothetical protein MZU91_05440 [Desulfosudis oleivorans]|nr:hypothetical protein [Desulfosudis oleivorans]
MVLLFSLPVFLSYGIIFNQNASYYFMLAGTMPPFLIICGTAGVGAALGLVKAFPRGGSKTYCFCWHCCCWLACICCFALSGRNGWWILMRL